MLRKKIILLSVIILLIVFQGRQSFGSVIGEPECFVKAEVVGMGSEERTLNTGGTYEWHYIDLKIIEFISGNHFVVTKGKVYRGTDRYPGILKKGDIIKAGVVSASSMGPAGAISFLHWSQVTYEDGSPIRNKRGAIVDFLTSDAEPLASKPF